MTTISLAAYAIKVKKKNSSKSKELIGNFGGDGSDLYEVMKKYLLERQKKPVVRKQDKKRLLVSKMSENIKERLIFGLIENGEYGYRTSLYDVEEDRHSYSRKVSDAEMYPFYYLMYLPKEYDTGLLLIQRFGNLGVRMVLAEDFKTFFSKYGGDYNVYFNPVIPEELINSVLGDGRVIALRFVSYGIPTDIADKIRYGSDQNKGYREYVIRAGTNEYFNIGKLLKNAFVSKKESNKIIEIEDIACDTLKVEFEINGARRTLDMSKVLNFKPYYDVTDTVSLGRDGHPLFNSIHQAGKDLQQDLAKGMGIL